MVRGIMLLIVLPFILLADDVIFRLEPFVEGNSTLYPGQRVKVGYKYIYNRNFDLTKENVPLLKGKGFRLIGDKTFKNSTQGDVTVSVVAQMIEAIKPGTYTFGPGLIQGKAYTQDAFGVKRYFDREYSAEAPEVTLKVIPFPGTEKPVSFNGAIGNFTLEVILLSASEVTVGDKTTLQITIRGTGEIQSVPMPQICCQPGFSGFFKMSDLPPVEKVVDSIKTFTLEMRPVSTSIREIPSLEFSFFDPDKKSYVTVKSKPIPFKVNPLLNAPQEEELKLTLGIPEKIKPPEVKAIDIAGNYPLSFFDFYNLPFGTWWVLLVIPIGGLLLYYRYDYKRHHLLILLFLGCAHLQAETIAERNEAIHKALESYKGYAPIHGNGKLYYDMANYYYELEQYPLAIFYYYEAQALRPRDPNVAKNLHATQQKLDIPGTEMTGIGSVISLPERLELFFLLSLITLGFALFYVWRLAGFFGGITGLLFLHLVYIHYFVSLEGVLLQGTNLYRDLTIQSKVTEKPLFSGLKVQLLDIHEGWLKIQTPDGHIGYIPQDSLRVIETRN